VTAGLQAIATLLLAGLLLVIPHAEDFEKDEKDDEADGSESSAKGGHGGGADDSIGVEPLVGCAGSVQSEGGVRPVAVVPVDT
jgi:hypothetical protein